MKELLILTADSFKTRCGYDPIILPNEQAAEAIHSQEKCPLKVLQWTGECLVKNQLGEFVWYYVAGNGPLHSPRTKIVLVEK